jgi:phosphoglycolate phosphatase
VVAAARGSQGARVVVVVIVNPPAAVLFDFDGVLADSRLAITRSLNHGLAAVGADERPAAELEHWIGPPLLHAFRALAGPERAEAGVAAYRERYRSASLSETVAVPGMVAAVARVAGAGVPVAVATSKPRALVLPLLDALGYAGLFGVVEGPSLEPALAEDKSVTVARALAALGLSPGADAVLVGDRSHDAAAAHANAIACVGVLWGIGDEEELRAAGATRLVRTPAELPAALGL